ncbi:transcription factor Adf-1-like isoform X1 [Pempheris klunzingeri]|uniref:transcription factor Adf-1-like isoform X1 n=1 Tax=Pempheris klunzingeri TaxID=3127111 RepID=UPI00397F2091
MNSTEKKLADLIRDHPNLYDQSRRDYKDSLKGHLSWKEIADNMGKSEEEVKLKWKNLRDKFCKAKKRMAKRSFPPLTDDSQVERPVPVLFNQLAWLSAYVKPRPGSGLGETDEGAGSGDDLERERDKGEKDQHGTLPVVSTSFSLVESCSNNHQEMGVSLKRKRPTTTETEISPADALTNLRDEDELFLLSLLPSLKRLTIKKRMEVRMKFQQVLYAAEFED